MGQGGGGGNIRKGGEQIGKKNKRGESEACSPAQLNSSQRTKSCGEPENGEKEQGEGRAGGRGDSPAHAAYGLGVASL